MEKKLLVLKPETIDAETKKQLFDAGYIVIETANPFGDLRIIEDYGDVKPDVLLEGALSVITDNSTAVSKLGEFIKKHALDKIQAKKHKS